MVALKKRPLLFPLVYRQRTYVRNRFGGVFVRPKPHESLNPIDAHQTKRETIVSLRRAFTLATRRVVLCCVVLCCVACCLLLFSQSTSHDGSIYSGNTDGLFELRGSIRIQPFMLFSVIEPNVPPPRSQQ